jgi:DNA modification methylase
MNKLYYGDNLTVLREYIPDESVDLVYLDPPFNSNATYNVLFKEKTGEESPAQIKAFTDSWEWTQEAQYTYEKEIILNPAAPQAVKDMISAFRQFIGQNAMMAYLVMMTPRLVELRRILKPSGSLFLHCDPTASHYLKILLDAVFGSEWFRNEIVWKRSDAKGDTGQGAKHYARVNDSILFCAKSSESKFNAQYGPLDPDYVQRFYRYTDPDGRRYKLDNMLGPGGAAKGNPEYEVLGVTRFWRYSKERMQQLIDAGRVVQTNPGTVPMYKRYLDESAGTPLTTNWPDISLVRGWSNERLGYPTQKPLGLLERIIKGSSSEGDTILDPFCGCGTAVAAAQALGRQWIGIDITHLAVALMKNRLRTAFNLEASKGYAVVGEPADVGSARALAEQDRFQFQYWALSLLEAFPREEGKKGADGGIDGVLSFIDGLKRVQHKAVVQVKSGHVSAPLIRDLKGVVEREKASLGLFITLEKPTSVMQTEAVSAGFFHSEIWQKDYPKIQLRTIEQLLDGNEFDLPPQLPSMYQPAQRVRRKEGRQAAFGESPTEH